MAKSNQPFQKLITASNLETFDSKVNEALADGYVVMGDHDHKLIPLPNGGGFAEQFLVWVEQRDV